MNKIEKLEYLQANHRNQWAKAYQESDDEVSKGQSMICVCGRLATGLHEMHCKKFKDKVISKAIDKLKHLLPKTNKQPLT